MFMKKVTQINMTMEMKQVMNIEQWTKEKEEIKQLYDNTKSITAKKALRKVYQELKEKIEDDQKRVKFGEVNQLPRPFQALGANEKTVQYIDNVIYYIDLSGKLGKEGNYNWYHYAWIPQTNVKYAKLCVHTLGKDKYGDRYYLEVDYYKHPADDYPYMTKKIDPFNRTYLPYTRYVLDVLGLNGEDYKYKTK